MPKQMYSFRVTDAKGATQINIRFKFDQIVFGLVNPVCNFEYSSFTLFLIKYRLGNNQTFFQKHNVLLK